MESISPLRQLFYFPTTTDSTKRKNSVPHNPSLRHIIALEPPGMPGFPLTQKTARTALFTAPTTVSPALGERGKRIGSRAVPHLSFGYYTTISFYMIE